MNLRLNKLIFSILFLLSILSCENSKQKLNYFLGYKKSVKSEVLENFPINNENFGYPYIVSIVNPSINKRCYSGIFITYQFENYIEFKKNVEVNSAITKHNIEINGEDSFVIPDSLSENIGKRVPVPSLDDEYNYLNKIVSSEESRFLVFNFDIGNFYKPPFQNILTDEYDKQGYSNGCIIDEKNLFITYWIMVW